MGVALRGSWEERAVLLIALPSTDNPIPVGVMIAFIAPVYIPTDKLNHTEYIRSPSINPKLHHIQATHPKHPLIPTQQSLLFLAPNKNYPPFLFSQTTLQYPFTNSVYLPHLRSSPYPILQPML